MFLAHLISLEMWYSYRNLDIFGISALFHFIWSRFALFLFIWPKFALFLFIWLRFCTSDWLNQSEAQNLGPMKRHTGIDFFMWHLPTNQRPLTIKAREEAKKKRLKQRDHLRYMIRGWIGKDLASCVPQLALNTICLIGPYWASFGLKQYLLHCASFGLKQYLLHCASFDLKWNLPHCTSLGLKQYLP